MKTQFFSAILATAFVAIFSGFVYAQTDAKGTLKPFTLADGRITIDMPVEPELEKEDTDGVLSISYMSEVEGILVHVSEFSYSDGTSMTDNESLNDSMMEAFFSGVLKGMKESDVDEEEIEIGPITKIEHAGMRGKEQVITLSGIPTLTRGLIGDGRMYFIGVMSSDAAQVKRILASFRVNKVTTRASLSAK